MPPTIFGLAERDENDAPDPDRVLIWGMELPDRVVLYWQDMDDRSQFAVFDDAETAARRYGRAFNLAVLRP